MTDEALEKAISALGHFTPLDVHAARFMCRLDPGGPPEILPGALLVSRHQRLGHVCLNLDLSAEDAAVQDLSQTGVSIPEPRTWAAALRKSPVVGRPGDFTPLILDDGRRLYLHRYWTYQSIIARDIQRRSASIPEGLDHRLLAEGMRRLFPRSSAPSMDRDPVDWQKVAAFAAVSHRFSVISGGPGTGKTTTVANILALLLEQAAETSPRIAMAAPTGKAAARLKASILREKSRLDSPFRDTIPDDVSTLHRLLGSLPDSPFFRHNAQNPLPVDLVVVDEASMVDVALMAKLVQAVPPTARLILLGDRDQLASVEAGAVLGDICDTGNFHHFSKTFCHAYEAITGEPLACPERDGEATPVPPLSDSIVLLRKSYRFDAKSGIGRASREINAGNGEGALALFTREDRPDVRWRELPGPESLARAIQPAVIAGFEAYLERLEDPAAMFAAFDRFRILAALRRGPFGTERLNAAAEAMLREKGLIRTDAPWYPGRPVMVTRNDYQLQLFNGDVGIAVKDAGGRIRVCFPESGGSFRTFSPLRLPPHETVYAMTVHKSQGSEFDHVMMVLPDQDSPVVTRELLYTGITRAVTSAEIWGRAPLFIRAAGRPTRRTSGLRDALWGRPPR